MQLTKELRTAAYDGDAKAAGPNQDLQDGAKALAGARWEEAAKAYSRAIQNNPASASAYLGRGVAEWYLAKNKNIFYTPQSAYQSAIADFTKAIELGGGGAVSLDAHYNLGLIYQKQGEYLESARHLRFAIAGAPNNQFYAEAYSELAPKLLEQGAALLKEGKTGESLEYFQIAGAIQPNSAQAELGQAKAILAKTKKMMADAEVANGMEENALSNLQEAIKHYQKALQLDPKAKDAPGMAECSYLTGAIYQNMGQTEKAFLYYSQAITIYDGAEYRRARAGVGAAGTGGELNLAETDLRKALQEQPRSAQLYIELAAVLQKGGKYEEAYEQLQKALRINHSYDLPQRTEEAKIKKLMSALGYDLVDASYAAREAGDAETAFHLADLGIEATQKGGGENPQGYYARAVMRRELAAIFEKQGDWDRAAGEYEDALADLQKFADLATLSSSIVLAETHHKLGIAYQRAGRLQDADKQFLLAIGIDPTEEAYTKSRISLADDYARRGVNRRKDGVAGAEDDFLQAIALDATGFGQFNGLGIYAYWQSRQLGFASAPSAIGRVETYLREAKEMLFEQIDRSIIERSRLQGPGLRIQTSAGGLELDERELAILRITNAVKKEGYLISYAPAQNAPGMIELVVSKQNETPENSLYSGFAGRFGQMYESLGAADRALLCMNLSLLLEPAMPELYYNRGMLNMQAKNWEGAIRDLQISIDLSINSGNENIGAREQLAEAYMQTGQLQSAQEQLQICQKLGAGAQKSWISSYEYKLSQIEKKYSEEGAKYFKAGQIDEAMMFFKSALDLNPQNKKHIENYQYCLNAVFEQAVRQFEAGNLEWARQKFESVRRMEPQNTRTHAYLGRIANAFADRAFAAEDYAAALAEYTEALKWGVQSAQIYHRRGVCFAQSGQSQSAIADFGMSISMEPQFSQVYADRGVERMKSEPKGALEDFELAINLSQGAGDLAPLHMLAGKLSYSLGMHARAIGHLNKALESEILNEETAASVNLMLARSYLDLGMTPLGAERLDNALEYYQRHDGQHVQEQSEAHLMRARLRMELGQYDLAEPDIDRLVALQPQNGNGYAMRAIVNAKKKEFEAAFADVETALEIAPELSIVYQARALVRYEMLYAPTAMVGMKDETALAKALADNNIDVKSKLNAETYALFVKKEINEVMLFNDKKEVYRLGREGESLRLDALGMSKETDKLYKAQKKKDGKKTFYASILFDYEQAIQYDSSNKQAREGLENMRRFAPIAGLDPEQMALSKPVIGVETTIQTPKVQAIRVMAVYWPTIRNVDEIFENTPHDPDFKKKEGWRPRDFYTEHELTNHDWANIAQKAKEGKKYGDGKDYNASEKMVAMQIAQIFWGQYLTRGIVPWYVSTSIYLYETQGRVAVALGGGYGPYQIISDPNQNSLDNKENGVNNEIKKWGGVPLKVLPEIGYDYGFRSYKEYTPHVYNLFSKKGRFTSEPTDPFLFAPTKKGFEFIRLAAKAYNSSPTQDEYGRVVGATSKYFVAKSNEYSNSGQALPTAPAILALAHQKDGSEPLGAELTGEEIAGGKVDVAATVLVPAVSMKSGYVAFNEKGIRGIMFDPSKVELALLKFKNQQNLAGAIKEANNTELASIKQLIAILTPGYYEPNGTTTCDIIMNGEVVEKGTKTKFETSQPYMFWIGTDGKAQIEPMADFWLKQPNRQSCPEVKFGIGSFPLKMDDGKKLFVADKTGASSRPRVAVAITAEGWVMVAAFDEMTYESVADAYVRQAAKMGVEIDKMMFLDGGESAKIGVMGEKPVLYEPKERTLARYLAIFGQLSEGSVDQGAEPKKDETGANNTKKK